MNSNSSKMKVAENRFLSPVEDGDDGDGWG